MASTVYFRQEMGGHASRRAISLGPTPRMTIEEDDASSDSDNEHGDNEIPPARRRHASFDLHHFHPGVVSHHTTTHIPSPAYVPSVEDTPEDSPASSEANLSATQPAQPPSQGSRPHSLLRDPISPPPVRHDQRSAITEASGGSITCPPVSQRRASQALEDFRKALKSDRDVPLSRPTPPQILAGTLASQTHSPSLHTPTNETPGRFSSSRSPDGRGGEAHSRSRSRSRFSLSVISDAILDSVRSHSPFTKRRDEGTPTKSDAHNRERSVESVRGRSREKGKGKSALIKVSEVFGLEPEEGGESRDTWKEFKKGAPPPNGVPRCPVPHGVRFQELTPILYHSPFRLTPHRLWSPCMVRSPGT
jgi:hypothetical protein